MLFNLIIILLVMLFVPLLCRLVRLPQIVGYILAGILVGSNGLGIIEQSQTISLIGKAGMIYLMFLSGIEIDMGDFRRSRMKSLLFGSLTFLLPCLLGVFTSRLLGFNWMSSILLGSMYGSHALMTYPIVSRYHLQQQNIVSIVVGGTMLAVTLSLLCLGAMSSVNAGQTGWKAIIIIAYHLLLFLVVIVGLFPRLASWFIKRQQDSVAEFLLVMLLVGFAAWLAEKAGLEAILGAFIAGVALNRRIPALSPLMNRINFVGNTFLIPIFLLSVGMMIDLKVFTEGWITLVLAAVMILTKCAGKYIAAWVTQLLLKLNGQERRLTFGLSYASSAGTLAVVTIGYNIGLLPTEVLNAALLLILVSCIVASFVTENAAKQISIEENAHEGQSVQQKVLISLDNPTTDTSLVDIALLTTSPRSKTKFTALAICNSYDDKQQAYNVAHQAAQYAAAADRKVEMLTQVAANTISGILQTKQYEQFTRIVMGINVSNQSPINHTMQHLLQSVTEQIMLYRQLQPLNTVERLRVIIAKHTEQEYGFVAAFENIRYLAMQTSARVTFYCNQHTTTALRQLCTREKKSLTASFVEIKTWIEHTSLDKDMERNDMLLLLLPHNLNSTLNNSVTQTIERYYRRHNLLLIYPEQK